MFCPVRDRIYNLNQSGEALDSDSQPQVEFLGQYQDDILDGARLFWKDHGLPPSLYLMETKFSMANPKAESQQETTATAVSNNAEEQGKGRKEQTEGQERE